MGISRPSSKKKQKAPLAAKNAAVFPAPQQGSQQRPQQWPPSQVNQERPPFRGNQLRSPVRGSQQRPPFQRSQQRSPAPPQHPLQQTPSKMFPKMANLPGHEQKTPSKEPEPSPPTAKSNPPTKSEARKANPNDPPDLAPITLTPSYYYDKQGFRNVPLTSENNRTPFMNQASDAENEYLMAPAYSQRSPLGKPGYMGWAWESPPTAVRRIYEGTSSKPEKQTGKKPGIFFLVLFGLLNFLSGMTISVQVSFYPLEAERRGATASEYGSLFGIFELIVFLASPVFGNYMNKIGPQNLFYVGTSVGSIAVVCFGLLDRISNHTWFITLSFLLRIFEGFGCASMVSGIFGITAQQYPESVPTYFAVLETCFGIGLILGPAFGGALYAVGGFRLSFFVVGIFLLITSFVYLSFTVPYVTAGKRRVEMDYSSWTILKIPAVALAAASIAFSAMSWAFVTSVLEPHIRRFQLPHIVTGLVFLVNGGTYGLSGPLYGYICKFVSRPAYIGVFGNVLIFVAFLLIGPAGFLPFDTILWVTLLGLFIQGLGMSCCLVSGFVVVFRSCLHYGLPDNPTTCGVASGLWSSMGCLGGWLGYTFSGILYSAVGLRNASYLILAIMFVVGISNLVYTCYSTSRWNKPSVKNLESQPLLKPPAHNQFDRMYQK